MSSTTRLNDLTRYEAVTDPGGPAMTWGMFAIGYLELGDVERGWSLFQKSYQPYYHPPFYMWTENVNGTGAVNFITGMGGFLQAVMFGYFGTRVHLDRIEFNPILPETVTIMNMDGVDYFGAEFDIVVTADVVELNFTSVQPDLPLVLYSQDNIVEIAEVQVVQIPREYFKLRPLQVEYLEKCPISDETIGN